MQWCNSAKGQKTQRLKDTRAQRHKGTKTQGHKDTKAQRCNIALYNSLLLHNGVAPCNSAVLLYGTAKHLSMA